MSEPSFMKYKELLKTILKTKKSRRIDLIKHSSNDFIKSLSEIALNVLKGVIPLTDKQKNQLRKWKDILKTVTLKKTAVSKQRDLFASNPKLVSAILKPLVLHL